MAGMLFNRFGLKSFRVVFFFALTLIPATQVLSTPHSTSNKFTAILNSRKIVEFPLLLKAGEVVDLTIAHRGVSLHASVRDPLKQKVISIASPTLWNGTLPIVFQAGRAGQYVIELTPDRPGNMKGEIEVERNEVDVADSKISVAVKAFKKLSDAEYQSLELYKTSTSRSVRAEAKSNFLAALELFDSVGNHRGVAMTALRLGQFLYDEMEDLQSAVQYLKRSTENYKYLGDQAGIAISQIKTILPIFYLKGKTPEVERLISDSIQISRDTDDRQMETRAISIKARILYDLGNPMDAVEILNRELEVSKKADIEGYQWLQLFAVSVYTYVTDPNKLNYFSRAAYETYLANSEKIHPAYSLNALYTSAEQRFIQKRDFKSYRILAFRTLELIERLGRSRQLARYQFAVAEILIKVGEYKAAEDLLKKSLHYFENNSPRETLAIHGFLGELYTQIGRFDLAKESLNKALSLAIQYKDIFAEAGIYKNLALLEFKSSNFKAALENIDIALSYTNSMRDTMYSQSVRTGFSVGTIREFSKKKIDILYSLFNTTGNGDYIDQAFEVMERIKAVELVEIISDIGLNLERSVDLNLRTDRDKLLSDIAQLEIESRHTPSLKDRNSFKISELLSRYDNLKEVISNKASSDKLLITQYSPSLKEFQKYIDSDTVAVQYLLGTEASYAIVVSKNERHFVTLESEAVITEAVLSLNRQISSSTSTPTTFNNANKKVSKALIAPLFLWLKGYKRVLIIPDDLLLSTPFASLAIPIDRGSGKEKFISQVFDTVLTPSAATLILLENRKSTAVSGSQNTVGVFSDPIYNREDTRFKDPDRKQQNLPTKTAAALSEFHFNSLQRLPFSQLEARKIASIVNEHVELFTAFRATRSRILSENLKHFRILHFATHGFINDSHPELSGLILSLYDSNGTAIDGLLRSIDLYDLKIESDLVILSGCQTIGDDDKLGKGTIGITRGFMNSGAKSVLSTLWKVDDAATAYFMEHFYVGLFEIGLDPPAALRYAQNQFLKSERWRSPRYWASFVIQGAWNSKFQKGNTENIRSESFNHQ